MQKYTKMKKGGKEGRRRLLTKSRLTGESHAKKKERKIEGMKTISKIPKKLIDRREKKLLERNQARKTAKRLKRRKKEDY